jgi:RarD protein
MQSSAKTRYVLSVVLFGTIGLCLRFVKLPSEIVVMCRGLIGSAFILLFRLFTGAKPDVKAIRKNLRWLLLSGACLGFNWIFLFAAYLNTTVAAASLVNYTAPIMLVAAAPILYKERLDGKKLLCVFASLLGVVLISGLFSGESVRLDGIFYAFLAALGFAALVVFNKKLDGITPYDRAVTQLFVSALVVLPYVLWRNLGTALTLDPLSVGITIMLGVLQTGVAYILYFGSITEIPVTTFAVLGYLEPAINVLSSALVLNEPMGLSGWLGAALIIGAAVVSELV